MNLNQFAAETRLKVFDDLKAGRNPSFGEYSEANLREGRSKGQPQLGATRYEPHAIFVEFIYPDPTTSSTVLTVKIDAPERIVFMPIPEWIVESIWQGEIDGSFQFEKDAKAMLNRFESQLDPESNSTLFGPKAPTRRG